VVAEEVRKLAERCRQATLEIGGLIQSSHAAVVDGVGAAGSTTDLIGKIHGAITTVSIQIQEIGVATQEQATTAGDIAKRMAESSREVGQNAAATHQLSATVHEVNRTAAELAKVSDALASAVGRFRLGPQLA